MASKGPRLVSKHAQNPLRSSQPVHELRKGLLISMPRDTSNYLFSESHLGESPSQTSLNLPSMSGITGRPQPHLSLMRSNFRSNKDKLLKSLFKENSHIH